MPVTMSNNVPMLENYLYISHLDQDLQYWFLPSTPDQVTDNMNSTFGQNTALGRSAPVFTYSNSGPRTVQINLRLHRDFMDDINLGKSNVKLGVGEDYVDNLIHAIQSIMVPKYNLSNKAVEPPLVAVRLGKEIFIKGVVTGGVGVSYQKPILYTDKYAEVTTAFTVTEVDPYDATSIYKNGSFRGILKTMRKGMNVAEDD